MIESLVLYLALGAVAGFIAGLFGVGGGVLIVPVLIFSFTLQQMPEAVMTHSAIATSLATIIVTSISSVRAHNLRGSVRWDLFKPLAVGISFGALIGVVIADSLSGAELQTLLGFFVTAVGIQMALDLKPKQGSKAPQKTELGIAGSLIGGASAVFGIGGGALTVPYLTLRGAGMHESVGTAAACGLPIAFFAALAYIWAGQDAQGMPPYSLGYIYLPALIGVGIASSQFARVGARMAHVLSQRRLKQVFAFFLLIIGIRFLVISFVVN